MPTCDICGKDISQSEMNVVSARVIVAATYKGYVPSKLPLEGLTSAFGFSRADSWRYTVQRNSSVDWGLCAGCLSEVRGYDTGVVGTGTVEQPKSSRPGKVPRKSKKNWWEFWKR